MSLPGFTKPRLERLHRVLAGYVTREEVPGLVALVMRNDDIHVECLGTLSVGDPSPMKRDTIFRIASMCKPMTAVAAMMLVEDCRIRLDDSIEPWLPELANRRVLRTIGAQLDDTVPARRAITVRDLLTFRMGFGSVMAKPDKHPIQVAIREQQIGGDGPPLPAKAPHADDWLARLGALPWMDQPGERWRYHVSADVLGVLLARITGQPLSAFLKERLFDPLGMKDTAFHVAFDRRSRLASSYRFDHGGNELVLFDGVRDSAWASPPPFESGGGGVVSTVDDCLAFQRLLLHKGKHGREQLLSRASVELMTCDQLQPVEREGAELFFGRHASWGFGMAVDILRDDLYRNPGRFGWEGGLGTSAYADPKEGLVGILLTQRMFDSPKAPHYLTDFWTAAYAAIE
jgi:CubicO group peptidase (beta-lactamase class C family)